LSPRSAIKFNVSFVNKRRNTTCFGTAKQCTARNMMLMQEKIREDQLRSALCKQRSFFTNVCQSSEDSVKASFAISEMIAKS